MKELLFQLTCSPQIKRPSSSARGLENTLTTRPAIRPVHKHLCKPCMIETRHPKVEKKYKLVKVPIHEVIIPSMLPVLICLTTLGFNPPLDASLRGVMMCLLYCDSFDDVGCEKDSERYMCGRCSSTGAARIEHAVIDVVRPRGRRRMREAIS